MLTAINNRFWFLILRKVFTFLLKVLIVGLLLYVIYQQLAVKVDKTDFFAAIRAAFRGGQLLYLLLAILLVGVNWGIEAIKWQRLLHPIEKLGYTQALGSVLCGVSFAMLTPNRTGEYGGRIITLQKADKWQAVALALAGSFAQLIANVGLSASGFVVFCFYFSPLGRHTWWLFMIGLVMLLAIAAYCFFRLNRMPVSVLNWKLGQRFIRFITPLKQTDNSTLRVVLGLSGLRYLVYLFQYYLLLLAFGVTLNWVNAWMLVGSIFFVQTIVPSIAVAELGIRGNLALYFIGYATTSQVAILSAALSLWAFNLALPALLGLAVVLVWGNLNP